MDKTKITQEQYKELWSNLKEAMNEIHHQVPEQQVTDALNNLLTELGYDIPKTSVMPPVTMGAWEAIDAADRGKVRVKSSIGIELYQRNYSTVEGRRVHVANAVMMAGSKALAEASMALLTAQWTPNGCYSNEAQAVIDALGECGVDVIEWKGGQDVAE